MFVMIFFSEEILSKAHDHVIWKGNTFNCDGFRTVDNFGGQYCGCVFLACTGRQYCWEDVADMAHCVIMNNDYNYLDMKSEDCGCHYHHQ